MSSRPKRAAGGTAVTVVDSTLRIESNDAPDRVGEILELLGEHRHRLRGIDVVEPNLDLVFNALTGRRIDDGAAP